MEKSGHELFIVDNSVSGWTGLRYLQEWTGIAKSFDIATGYFEIGALLALEGKWQQLDKIRILMGDETTQRTKQAILDAVRARATDKLDKSIESNKEGNPFLSGVAAIVDALRSGKIECKIYNKDKFHAKAYITHAKLDVVGSQALVGSSNFTYPGLTENIELNIQVQSSREVAQLRDWFEFHWKDAVDINDAIIRIIERHVREYTPFEVYSKALQEFFRGHEMTAAEWEETKSKMFSKLDQYQKEGYWALMKIARQYGGAFLCDGVGLGKTFVGLMLIERLILQEGKRVVLFAPKSAKEAVWEPHLRKWLPHIGSTDFSNLAIFSHTDLGREGEFPERFKRIAEQADVVIIDEAHHFRNTGIQSEGGLWDDKSRYYRLYDLLDISKKPKTLFMLTATPINNRLSDFRHMVELFSRRNESYFARTLGVNNLTAHFNKMERELRVQLGSETAALGENLFAVQKSLSMDDIFKHLVVQRSRAYAKESQKREFGKTSSFPERKSPQVADYSIHKTYGHLLEMFERAFAKDKPLFNLPIYYPLAYYKGKDKTIDPMEEGRQKQVVGLIRIQFLKRFESSIRAFELSSDRLMRKLLAFLEKHSETEIEKKRLYRWKQINNEILDYAMARQLQLWGDSEEDQDEDIVSEELLESIEKLDREEYKVEEIIDETYLDLDQIAKFLEETKRFNPKSDDKLKKLVSILKSKDCAFQKVLIFTEFADTAKYIAAELKDAGIKDVDQIDSSTKNARSEVLERFAPYYNGKSSEELKAAGQKETRVLIATDVLSEGINLQDATRMINYDIHWNPVRLMQRIGRVDRRMDPEIEKRILDAHPEFKSSRGKVCFWNFLPPDELNKILSLYAKVSQKTLLISKTLGIEGKKLLTPDDDFEAIKEFNQAYEGAKTLLEDMHLEYQEMVNKDPNIQANAKSLPCGVFSGKEHARKGVFFCYALPALDKDLGAFTEEAGVARWYYYDSARNTILEDPSEIVEVIRSEPSTPRACSMPQEGLKEIKGKILKHITNTYLKRVDAPIGVKPTLKCWMEIN